MLVNVLVLANVVIYVPESCELVFEALLALHTKLRRKKMSTSQ